VLRRHARSLARLVVFVISVGLVAVATVAALLPANRAARLRIVDALRHV